MKEQSEDRSMVMREPRRSDESTPSAGRLEDILRFALEPRPVHPVPEVRSLTQVLE